MIGQAGTGSPEAGVDPRVLVYTVRTGDETRHPGARNKLGSPVFGVHGYLTASPP